MISSKFESLLKTGVLALWMTQFLLVGCAKKKAEMELEGEWKVVSYKNANHHDLECVYRHGIGDIDTLTAFGVLRFHDKLFELTIDSLPLYPGDTADQLGECYQMRVPTSGSWKVKRHTKSWIDGTHSYDIVLDGQLWYLDFSDNEKPNDQTDDMGLYYSNDGFETSMLLRR